MKILVRLVVVLVVLFAALLVAAQVIVNRPFVREKVMQAISQQLHREFSLSGLSLSLFPSIALNLKDFSIKEKNNTDTFASLDRLSIKVALMPLLKKKLVVNEVLLDRPRVTVEKKENGDFNFSDLIPAGADSAVEEPEKSEPSSDAVSASAPPVQVDLIRVNKAEFNYKESTSQESANNFSVSDLNLEVDNFSMTAPVAIQLECLLGPSAKVSFKGEVGPLGDRSNMEAKLVVALENLNSSDLEAFIPKEALQGKGFQNLNIKGTIEGGLAKGISGNLNVGLKILPQNRDISLNSVFSAKGMDEVSLDNFEINLGQAKIQFKGRVASLSGPKENVEINLTMDISGLHSRELEDFIPKEQLQGFGFENFSVKGGVAGSLGSKIDASLDLSVKLFPAGRDIQFKGLVRAKGTDDIVLDNASIKTGSSDITLTGSIKNMDAPQGQFNLSSTQLNADDFLALIPQTPGESPEKQAPTQAKESAPSSAVVPENPLYNNAQFQNAKISFSTDLKKVQYEANIVENIILKVMLDHGVLSFKEFSLQTFGGGLKGDGVVNLKGEKIAFDLNTDLSGVQLQQITKANLGEEKVFGTLTGSAAFKGTGFSKPDLEKSLSGYAKVEVKEGKIVGQSMKAQIIEKMDNPILVQMLPGLAKMKEDVKNNPQNETPFEDAVVDVVIDQGKITVNKVNLTSADFTARASGTAYFNMKSDLKAQVVFSKELTETLTGNNQSVLDVLPRENDGLLLPAQINSIDPISVLPDFGVILSALAKGGLTDKIGGLLGGGKDGKSSNPLSKLFGGGNKTQPAGGETQQGGTQQTATKAIGSLLGGGSTQTGSTEAAQAQTAGQTQTKSSPLGNLLGAGSSSSGSKSSSPLGSLFGGGSNSQSEAQTEQSQESKESSSPFSKLKLF